MDERLTNIYPDHTIATALSTSQFKSEIVEDARTRLSKAVVLHNELFAADWMRSLGSEFPELMSLLVRNNVTDDNQYLVFRLRMSSLERDQVDDYRFSCRQPLRKLWDPFQVLRILPWRCLQTSVGSLDLSVRLTNVFQRENITRLEDLLAFDRDAAMKWPAFGKKCLTDLLQEVRMIADSVAIPVKTVTPPPLPEDGWLADLSNDDAQLSNQLKSDGISSDAKYLDSRAALSKDLQLAVDLYRFKKRVMTIDQADPLQVITIAPKWLLDSPVDEVFLTPRIVHVFDRIGLKAIGNLVTYTEEQLLQIKNFGKKSFRDLAYHLTRAILRGPVSNLDQSVEVDVDEPLLTAYLRSMAALSTNQRRILGLRLGENGDQQTLEQIGQTSGVTRERIRQIEGKAIAHIWKTEIWPKILYARLDDLTKIQRQPVYLDILAVLDPWMGGFETSLTNFKYIIEVFTQGRFVVLQDNIGRPFLSRLSRDSAAKVLKKIVNCLEGYQAILSKSDVRAVVRSFASVAGDGSLSDILFDQLSTRLQWAHNDETSEEYLISVGNETIGVLVKKVMANAKSPIHFSKVAAKCSDLSHRDVGLGTVQNILMQDYLYFGRGTYGERRHFHFSESECEEIRCYAEAIICEQGPNRQWGCHEILDLLDDYIGGLPKHLNKFHLNIILLESSELKNIGRLVWMWKDAVKISRSRIDIEDAVLTLLHASGRPMTGAEIVKQIEVTRGVSFLLINPSKQIGRVGPNQWGLVERDFHLTTTERARTLDALCECLREFNHGLHVSELKSALLASKIVTAESMTDYMLYGLAQTDDRIRSCHGLFVALREWEGPRRLSVKEAMALVSQQVKNPTSRNTLHNLVEKLIERPLIKSDLAVALQNSDLIYNRDTQLWYLPSDDDLGYTPDLTDPSVRRATV